MLAENTEMSRQMLEGSKQLGEMRGGRERSFVE
jgi:hypothetical protein